MTYYIIKTHYIPTEKNSNQKVANEHFWYSGKGGQNMNTESPYGQMYNNKIDDSQYMLNEYAYKRLCDAKRGLKSRQELDEWETEYGFWKVSSEIVEVIK